MKKKIILMLSMVAFAVCLLAISVSAVDIDGIDYSFKNGEATVTSANQNCELEVVNIPETVTYEGVEYTVTTIANSAFRNNGVVKSITTPSTIKHIGTHAFREMTKLEEITLNTSAEFTKFEDAEVYSCKALKKADLSGMVGLVDMGGGGTYDHTFTYCSSLTEVILPESLLIIGTHAFNGCTSLANIDLPKNLTTIRGNAFTNCAFTTIEIPKTVTYIGDYAFQSCKNLVSLNIPVVVTYFGCNNFQYTKVEKVVFPSTVTGAGKDMFHGLSTLKTVVIGCADLSNYNGSFFSGCGSITTLFYGGKDPSVLTNKYTGYKSYELVTYEQYLNNLRNPEFEGYAGKVLVYGIDTCTGCGDVVTAEHGFIFESLIDKMYMGAMCANCGEKTVTEEFAPVFVDLGYSTYESDGKCSIVHGYLIDRDSLDVYNEKLEDNQVSVFGVLAVAKSKVSDVAFDEDGNALQGVISYEMKTNHDCLEIKVTNIPSDTTLENGTAYTDIKIHLCAYVKVGDTIYYIGGGSVSERLSEAQSYNSLQ